VKLAVILFVLDVGVRRIDLDRAEWAKMTAILRKWIFFWKGTPRPVEADESLATLLARRGEVRTTRTAAGSGERPELFQPQHAAPPVESPAPDKVLGETSPAAERPPAPPQASPDAEQPAGTTSRLLEAKRRAQKRRDG
jgi:hypothetical protein